MRIFAKISIPLTAGAYKFIQFTQSVILFDFILISFVKKIEKFCFSFVNVELHFIHLNFD